MKFHLDRYVEEEDDWEIIPVKWWYTSFKAVSWSYNSKQGQGQSKPSRRQYQGSLFAGIISKRGSERLPMSPPPRASSREAGVGDEEDSLNLDLVGVKGAMEVVMEYEKDVGFYFTIFPDLGLYSDTKVDLSVDIDENDLQAGRERWNSLSEELMNGPAFENTTDSDESMESSFIGSISSYGDLSHSTSSLSSIDTTRSEGSIDSIPMPSTPKAKLSFNDVMVKDVSPAGSLDGSSGPSLHLSPSRSLNASASSFVPTFCSQLNEEPVHFPSLADDPKSRPDVRSPPASFANFTFPTLNPTPLAPAVKIKKDDQGFFTEIQVDNSLGGDLLPPFLQEPPQRNRTRKSRTREIVDRIRSQIAPEDSGTGHSLHLNPISPKYASHSPSPICDESNFITPRLSVSEDGGDRLSRLSSPSCDDDDGWIDVVQPAVSSPNQKSTRARELFRALTRRRTDSSSSGDLREAVASETSSGLSRNVSSSPSPSPSPQTPPPLVTNDGWVESSTVSPPEPQKKPKASQSHTHHRKKSSVQHQHHQHHGSRTSFSSSSSSSHLQQPFSASSPHYPQLSPTAMSPHHPQHIVPPPAAFPYFFPAYPAIAMPSPYAATFMQVPTYPMGMPMHTAHVAPAAGSMPVAPYMAPPLMPGRTASMKPAAPLTSTPTNMNMPAYRAKHSPLW
ncbi:hypothetical protein GALMADRAFT_156549 [Galerina marginata CBS 339.88]|uniref:Uncharacterized protein n=1 Tax=Galerina marginata (strain CBS 339.88) TaxID=685588 RepID=A0A067T985_GALM3|nr:hypothetical protein GALMADRAFT_156549 [Galerina marginata CBS 339.88]